MHVRSPTGTLDQVAKLQLESCRLGLENPRASEILAKKFLDQVAK